MESDIIFESSDSECYEDFTLGNFDFFDEHVGEGDPTSRKRKHHLHQNKITQKCQKLLKEEEAKF